MRPFNDSNKVPSGRLATKANPSFFAWSYLRNTNNSAVSPFAVAAGVIEAFNKLGNIDIPIIVRLQGTNAVEAKKLIDESGLKVQSAILLSEAADLVKQAVA